MTPEARKAAKEALNDTMTVNQAKQRKLDLRAQELELRQKTEQRKADEAAAREKRRQEREAKAQERRDERAKKQEERQKQKQADKVAREKAAEARAKDQKDAAGTSAVIKAKQARDAAEDKKLAKLKGIAAKRKEGVAKSMDRAKQVGSNLKLGKISKDQGNISAMGSVAGNLAKGAIAGGRVGFNVAKAGIKGVAGAGDRIKAARAQGAADAKERKIEKRNEKLASARADRVQARLKRRQEFRRNQNKVSEEFIQEVDQMATKEKKAAKVIDIMKGGQNKIEISPKVSEQMDWQKDYKPLEIETVDIIKAEPLNPSNWRNDLQVTDEGYSALVRQGIKYGGKSGGKAVRRGEKAVVAKGRQVASDARQGNQKKMVGDGKYEKIGATVGGIAGGAAGFLVPDGPAMVAGEIAGGIAGSKLGGKIGRQFDKNRAKKVEEEIKNPLVTQTDGKAKAVTKLKNKYCDKNLAPAAKTGMGVKEEVIDEAPKYDKKGLDKYDRSKRMIRHKQAKYGVATFKQSLMHGADHNIDNEKKAKLKEEESDRLKDRRMERGGVGGNQRYDRAPKAPNTKKFGSGKTMAQKEMEKKYGKGKSAMDIVRADIEKKYGKGALMKPKTKKEEFSDWRSDEQIQEFIKFTDAAKRRAEWRKNHPTGGDFTKWKPEVDVPLVPNSEKIDITKGTVKGPITDKIKTGIDTAKKIGSAASSGIGKAATWAANNPGKAGLAAAGVVGAGLVAKKMLSKKKEETKEGYSNWRTELYNI